MSAPTSGPLGHLVPADQVAAVYDDAKRVLTLTAKGEFQPVTTDIQFVRLPWIGGLKFELWGYGYPVGKPKEPYQVTNKFLIPSLPGMDNVIVETFNQQWTVDIKHLGLKPAPLTPATPDQLKFVPATQNIENDDKIVTFDGVPFKISQGDVFPPPGQGTVSVAYDKDYVNLVDARIVDNKIEWTFVPHQPGNTEVDVYVGHENPPYVYRIPYEVDIVLTGPGPVHSGQQNTVTFSVSQQATNGRH